MARKHLVTAAVRALRDAEVTYTEHHYKYDSGSGALGGAEQLGIDAHRMIKTLILETSAGDPICVLMHGDREVSLKQLARILGVKSVAMATTQRATAHSGYLVGGTSPFGLRKALPVYCQATIADYESIVINGGKRGFLVELPFADLAALLEPELVDVATTR